ncbi:hypothetical protein ACTSKR_12220 [Chitinibacteraceae bacterium HSL-7]
MSHDAHATPHPSSLFVDDQESWQKLKSERERSTDERIARSRAKRAVRAELMAKLSGSGYTLEELLELTR